MRVNGFYASDYKNNMRQINFEAIRIKQITPEYSALKRVLETELDGFVKRGDNAEVIGKGLSATVYRFNRFKDVVFKKSETKKTDFAQEINNLKVLPEGLNTVQRFIAQAFDDESGIFYLLSTKMNGKTANPRTNPYTAEHLKSLFDTFFELDKNGIYHGDFNLGNVLLDSEGKTNLIDFQWMQRVEYKRFFENKPNIVLPPFILSENSQMFEMASLPFYIKEFTNGKSFLTDYLRAKSVYHEKRGEYLKGLLSNWEYNSEKPDILKGINYENAQALLLRYPDNNLLKLEAKKLQFLSSFREAFSRNDINNPEGNFVTSPSAHLLTLSYLQDLRAEIIRQKKQKYLSSAQSDYLNITEEYAKYWFGSIKSWIGGIFDGDIKRAVNIGNKTISDKLEGISDLSEHLDIRYKIQYTKPFDLAGNTSGGDILKGIKSGHKKLKFQTLSMIFDTKIMKKQNEIGKTNDRIMKAFDSDRALDVINLSILNIVKNRELKHLIMSKPNLKNRDEIITELHDLRLLYENMARENFRYVLRELDFDASGNVKLSGYVDMNSFKS